MSSQKTKKVQTESARTSSSIENEKPGNVVANGPRRGAEAEK